MRAALAAAEADASDAHAEVLDLRDALAQLDAALRDSQAKQCARPAPDWRAACAVGATPAEVMCTCREHACPAISTKATEWCA